MEGSERENYVQHRARIAELEQRRLRIRELNDRLRKNHVGGRINITTGVDALGPLGLLEVLETIRAFDDFSENNDPHQEHDFGAIEHGGNRIFWKIDCYDKQLEFGSPDASNPDVTARVMTIMLAEEY
jgi:hypothetical protein